MMSYPSRNQLTWLSSLSLSRRYYKLDPTMLWYDITKNIIDKTTTYELDMHK